MKRKIIIILAFIVCMFLTSCCAPADYSGYSTKTKPVHEKEEHEHAPKKESFTKVAPIFISHGIYRHNATGVLYLVVGETGVVMLVNEDGTPYVQK
jgi:hypothetical protein